MSNIQDKATTAKAIKDFKNINKWFSDTCSAFKGTELVEALKVTLPWAENIVDAAGESFAVAKFVCKIFENYTKITDTFELAYLACVETYKGSLIEAIKIIGEPKDKNISKLQLQDINENEINPEDFEDFDFSSSINNTFISKYEKNCEKFLKACGYNEEQIFKILRKVRERYNINFNKLLAENPKNFQAVINHLELGKKDEEIKARKDLENYAYLNNYFFTSESVFFENNYSLSDIYEQVECGCLSWKEICNRQNRDDLGYNRPKKALDVFDEETGGRELINKIVSELIDGDYNEPIVIQGPAGSGKSSFTLWLNNKLMEEGLTPIRIQFKHIDFNGDFDLYSELHNAVKTATASLKSSIEPKKDDFSCLSSENVFLNGKIFEDTTTYYKNNKLCPYVLILDGWDELSLAQSQTFKDRIDKVLATVKKNLITSNDKSKVKIIVTGRPTEDVTKDSNFITPNTKILTIKPLNPESLNNLFDNIVKHSQYPDHAKMKEEIKSIIEAYTEYFNSRTEQELINQHYEAIGMPLLAALVLKLASNEDYQLKELFNNPTDLYRSLADLTVEYGGRDEKAFDKIKKNIYAASNQKMDLRSLFREIAIAISILGKESISSYELETRLLHPENNISTQVEDIIKKDSISRLYALFYFKAGHKSYGCEFIHKSFREYFFAEALIVKLIQAGSDLKINNNEETKIKHFKKLSCILAPRWLTPEINNHVKNLIEYHINISDEEKLEIWEITRDWLADYFVWWADKEHMTPQMYLNRRGEAQTEPPFVEELAQETRPYDYEKDKLPKITDYISLDSHLGDSVFQLNCYVHAFIAVKKLNLANIEQWSWENSNQCHKHQWNIEIEGQNFTVFGFIGSETFEKNENDYLLNYFARINSTPGRPQGMAPLSYFMPLINFSGVDLSHASLYNARLDYASLDYARLDYARLDYASLYNARLDYASLDYAHLYNASLDYAHLYNASLDYALNLTLKQIESAYIYGSTKLPIYIWEQMGADENERQEYFEKLIK